MNNKPSLESQFLAALLAFTSLLYGNVWLMTQESVRPAETAGYAVDSQPAQGVPPDFSGWSREEVGEYVVREMERQAASRTNYVAAAAKSFDSAATDVKSPESSQVVTPPTPLYNTSPPQPQMTPGAAQPFQVSFTLPQQCNTSMGLFEFPLPNDIRPESFIAPTANGGEFAGIFSVYTVYPPAIQLMSFGSPSLIPARGLVKLVDITNYAAGLQARGNLLAYIAQRQNSPTLYDELWIRDTGSDGLFEPRGNDRSRLIFSSANGIQISGTSYPALGNDRLVFTVSVAGQTSPYVIEVRFPNGIAGQLSYEVLPTWRLPFALPQNYRISQVQVGVQNVGVVFVDPARGSDVAVDMHPGLGGWNEGDEIFYQIGGGRRGGRPQMVVMIAVAPDDRLAVAVERDSTVTPPLVSNQIIVSDFGLDGIPQTGDPGERAYTLPAVSMPYSSLALGGFAPQGPGRSYPSNSRMSFELNELVTRGGIPPYPYLRVSTFNFVDIGPDGVYGTSDDVTQSRDADGGFTLRFAEQSVGNAFGIWRKVNADPRTQRAYSTKIHGTQWCY